MNLGGKSFQKNKICFSNKSNAALKKEKLMTRSFQITTQINKMLYIWGLTKHGVDWFRQQGQWVSKHAENRSAISLIPCYTLLTGDQEFALAA